MKMVLPRLVDYIKAEKKKGTFYLTAQELTDTYTITVVLPKKGGAVSTEMFNEVKKMLEVD